MKTTIKPSKVAGQIFAPASKSMTIRAIAASAASRSSVRLSGFTPCNDANAALEIIRYFGKEITENGNTIEISGMIKPSQKIVLNCGESALTAHLFVPLASVFFDFIEIVGEGSLLNRNLKTLFDALQMLGVESNGNGFLPAKINGKLNGGSIKIDGSGGSQTLSGLLFALPLCKNNSVIEVENLKSKPYIDLTINILKDFGVEILHSDYKIFKICGNQTYHIQNTINIEGDWSGASCLLVAGAVAGEIAIENLYINSSQSDKKIIDVLQMCGAEVMAENNIVFVKHNALNAFEFDATDCPDLFPALAALAANCNGVSTIKGAQRLQNKESNRAEALQQEFAKIGVQINLNGDIMKITGAPNAIKAAEIDSHNDHRIAMSLAVAALNANGEVVINNAECVAKSYPRFWIDFMRIKN